MEHLPLEVTVTTQVLFGVMCGCDRPADVIRKFDRNNVERIPVMASCGDCTPFPLTPEQQIIAATALGLALPVKDQDYVIDFTDAQIASQLNGFGRVHETVSQQMRYY